MSMKKILLLVNDVTTIVQFRTELIRALVDDGNQVYVSVPKHIFNHLTAAEKYYFCVNFEVEG